MKKSFSLLTLAVMLATLQVASHTHPILAAQSTFGCSPSVMTVRTGQYFYFTVVVNDIADLYAWQFDTEFNTTYLRFISIMPGPFLHNDSAQRYTLAPLLSSGKAQRAAQTRLSRNAGVTGSGVIAHIYVQALQDSTGTNVNLTNRKLVDRNAVDLTTTLINSGHCKVVISSTAPYLEQPPIGELQFIPMITR